MATYKINGQLNVVFSEVEIDAATKFEALKKLYRMDVKDIIEECSIDESDFVDEDAKLVEADYKIRVKGINYSIEPEDIWDQVAKKFPDVEEGTEEFDNLVDDEIKKIATSLPDSLDLEIRMAREEDLDWMISDAISDETGWLVNFYESYIILEVK